VIRRGAIICTLVSLVVLAAATTATAARPRVPVGDAASLTRGVSIAGPVRAARRMRLTIGLASRDPLGLQAFSTAVTTPGSPQYGRFLTVRQFAHRFGATDGALAQVRRALRAEGLTVLTTAADHLAVTVSGDAGTIERAFDTRLEQVRIARRARVTVNTTAPTVPASLARDVDAVLGLDGLAEPAAAGSVLTPSAGARRPGADARPRMATGGPQPCPAARRTAAQLAPGTSPIRSFGYTGDAIAAAYGVPSLYARGDFGQGQTVAVFEQQSLDPRDIAAYQACDGTHAVVHIRNVDRPAPVDTGVGGDGEAALDVEQVISVAPRASIIVYAAAQSDQDGTDALLSAIASQDAAKVVSISYSTCEAAVGRTAIEYEAKLFEEMAAQGQSVFASSGDQGAEGCSPPNGSDRTDLTVADPASQPTVTGVGGTALYSGSAADPVPWNGSDALTEGIWNAGPFQQQGTTVGQATGGGLSSLWAMPRFQSRAAAPLGVVDGFTATGHCGARACREVPDVSADADWSTGVVVYAAPGDNGAGGSSWTVAGGTSVSAPLWAGFAALTDAQPSCRGLSIGDLNPSLYALASADYGAYFRDVDAPSPFTAATSNDATGAHPGTYPVGPGYDLATGLGAPMMGSLAPALCARRAPVYVVTVTSPGTIRLRAHRHASVTVRATDSGGARLRFAARGLPAGLSIGARTGRITGRPTHPGRYRVTVRAADFAANAARTRFTIVVRAAPGRASRSSAPRSARGRRASGTRRAPRA